MQGAHGGLRGGIEAYASGDVHMEASGNVCIDGGLRGGGRAGHLAGAVARHALVHDGAHLPD